MRFEIITLFPEFFDVLKIGLTGKAIDAKMIEIITLNPRMFALDRYQKIDDAPYGGGAGMVMMVEPLVHCLEYLDDRRDVSTYKILLTPQGDTFDQPMAHRFSKHSVLTFVCGRYEGVDARILSYVDAEVSIGDIVLLGGEVPALVIIEAVARLLTGVIGNSESVEQESFCQGLLEYPQYTRPSSFRGQAVPPVLLHGNHHAIKTWRIQESLKKTIRKRPELIDDTKLDSERSKIYREFQEKKQ